MNLQNPKNIVKFEISKFIDNINNRYPQWNLNHRKYIENIFRKNTRCMGRMWDIGKSKFGYKLGDINKQCTNRAVINELCKSCFNKSSAGRVDEMPNEKKVLIDYRKYFKKRQTLGDKNFIGRDVDIEINLNKYKELIEKKSPKKFSNKKIKDMSLIKESNTSIEIIPNEKIHRQEIHKNLLSNNDINDEWWNSDLTDKIKIYDNINNSYFVFAMEESSNGEYLLNKNQVVLGEYRDWVDCKNQVPDCFKNKENKVLDPYTALPLREFEIYKDSVIYHDLNPSVYRKYRYNKNTEELTFTNSIEE